MVIIQAQVSTVASLNARKDMGMEFLSDSQDVDALREQVGGSSADYDSFFVSIGDGEYREVWGMSGIVPLLSKLVTRIA